MVLSFSSLLLLLCLSPIESNSWRRSAIFNEDFLSILVVGKTGTGKSTTCNTLIDEQKFAVAGAFESVTKQVQYGDVTYNGTTYRIFDTPGYLDVDLSSMDVTDQIADWVRSSTHGIDAFILLFPYGRLGKEHWESYQTFKNSFGIDALNRTIVALTQLRPTSLSSEDAALHITQCCKPGGQLRQVCCEVLELQHLDQPILGVGDPTDPSRRALDRNEIFRAIRSVSKKFPTPYSNRVFDEIHANRTKLLQEINLLKYNKNRIAMRKLYEDYYAPEGGRGIDGSNKEVSISTLWVEMRKFQASEKKAHDGVATKWGYRFIAAIVVSLILEAIVSLNEPLMWIERTYRSLLFFALYSTFCITDLGRIGLQSVIRMIPPLWIFDVTSLMDVYFKLDDIIPLGAAALVQLIYISTHAGIRYIINFFEAAYLAVIVGTLVHEIVIHGQFEPPKGELPIERWSFIVIAVSIFASICRFDVDHSLNANAIPVPIWRFRMVWRRPVRTRFEPVETDTNLYDDVPEDEYPLRWRRVDTPWSLDSFRNERQERLEELQKNIRLEHKDRGNVHTVKALEELGNIPINLPAPNVGAEIEERTFHTLCAVVNGFGALLLFLGYPIGTFVALLDVLYLSQRVLSFLWYACIAVDPQEECGRYQKEWVVHELDLKE